MRILATFAFAFSAGIFLAQYVLPTTWLLPCAAAAFVLALGRAFVRGTAGRRLLLVGIGLSLAFGWNWLYLRQVQQPMEALADTEQTVVMTLCDYAEKTDYGAKGTVRLEGLPGKAVYYGEEALLELRPGQTVEDSVYFQSAARIRDDDVTTFTSKGIFLLAYQRGDAVFGEGTMDSPRWWPAGMGRAMCQQIAEMMEGDTAAFLTAILTGDKSGLSAQASADLSEAGLYHILAVSGMHCGFLLVLVALLTGRHRRRLVAGIMMLLLVFYALLTGGSPSVVRACVMLMFLLAAPLFRRDSDGPTALAAALFLILLTNPFAAASISLQLSFAAMAGILWMTPKLYRLLKGGKRPNRIRNFVISGFSATMGALVFTVPLSAYYFGTLVLISPLSNLLCLWAASVVFILGLLAVLAGLVWLPLGVALSVLPRVLIRYILAVAHLLAEIPYHAVYFTNPYLKYWLAFAYLLFAAAYLMKPKAGRKYAMAALLAAVTLAVTAHLGVRRYQSSLDVLALDVGQGQCVLLASEEQFALVDCGSGNSWYRAGTVAADQLRTMGCRELDYLILTHYDEDHINGMEELLARLDVAEILLPAGGEDPGVQTEVRALAEAYRAEIRTVSGVTEVPLGLAEMTVFPPVGEGEDNNRGLAVLAGAEGKDLLITGDMDSETERKFMAAYELPEIEYLVAGHHGSKHSTSDDLLDTLVPETVLISVGSNSYGHPSDEVMRRLAAHDCAVYRTDMHGTIHLLFN